MFSIQPMIDPLKQKSHDHPRRNIRKIMLIDLNPRVSNVSSPAIQADCRKPLVARSDPGVPMFRK